MSSQPVKRDKFAALAAQQNQQQTVVPQGAPKRDKFASLQAKQADAVPAPPVAAASGSLQATVAPVKRDKFASLQSTRDESFGTTSVRRGDKFAAVQQQKKVADQHNKKQELIDKCRQRDVVWNDLETAEAAVIRLLQLAEKTTALLAEQTMEPLHHDSFTTNSLISMQSEYQETVHQIHTLLKPHAEFVKAYEEPTRVNPMYLHRVELRLADSKARLLEKLNHNLQAELPQLNVGESEVLEHSSEGERDTNDGKRKRDT